MKTLLLIILLFAEQAIGQVASVVGPGRTQPALSRHPRYHNHPLTPLLFEDFENPTGYDLPGWTEVIVNGAINEDYTATVLFGTQSLFVDQASDDPTYVTNSFAATSRVFLAFRFRVLSATDAAGPRSVIRLLAADNTCLYRLNINNDEQEIFGLICETSDSTQNLIFAYNTTYTVWIEYNRDNGANSYTSLAMSTSAIRPLPGSANFVEVAGVQLSTVPARIMIGSDNDDSQVELDFIVDHLLIDDEQINDWP